MEVMDSRELEQTEVLIGQRGKSQSMGVSDDAALMSMLSTGLYQFPLRTMLQEILFNAWDAHRMGKCQDKPFDVYLNDTTGLIVRDYGPGIHPDMMQPIYCVYGNSTKRDNSELTGGFGLGSKSPFAYCDSFTVTSMHEGSKNMYLIMKASDEHNGKPGMTPVIENVPTDETGLMVTVPMKTEDDRVRAYEYIKDISFLSGMKFNLHFATGDNSKTELIVGEEVNPRGFTFGNEVHDDHHKRSRGVYAVYGGVRYEIVPDDDYQQEYDFLSRLSRNTGAFYLHFPPNSLTPLPSREGLNLSEKTKENIQSRVELLAEQMQELISPVLNNVVKFSLDELIRVGLPYREMTHRWAGLANNNLSKCMPGMYRERYSDRPDMALLKEHAEWQELVKSPPQNADQGMWEGLCRLAFFETGQAERLIAGKDVSVTMARMHYLRFKDMKARRYIMDKEMRGSVTFDQQTVAKRQADVILLQKDLMKLTGQKCDIRVIPTHREKWSIARNIRGGGKVNTRGLNSKREQIVKTLSAKKELKLPTTASPNQLWSSHDGEKVTSVFGEKMIIIARTVGDLNDDTFLFNQQLCRNVDPSISRKVQEDIARWFGNKNCDRIPAIVISEKKGGWDKAVAYLAENGWYVIEADEQEKLQQEKFDTLEGSFATVSAKPAPVGYPRLNLKLHHWGDEDDTNGIAKPKIYLWCTHGAFDEYRYWGSKPYPSQDLVRCMQSYQPSMVIIHNRQRESGLIKKGAVSFAQAVDDRLQKLIKNKDRFRLVLLHELAREEVNLPPAVMGIPEMQKQFGLPYLRTKQKESIERELEFLNLVRVDNSDHVWDRTKKLLEDESLRLQRDDPQFATVKRMAKVTDVFDQQALHHRVGSKRAANKLLAEKIIRFLKTV